MATGAEIHMMTETKVRHQGAHLHSVIFSTFCVEVVAAAAVAVAVVLAMEAVAWVVQV